VDEQTLQFYRGNAQAYAGREITRHTRLTRFLALPGEVRGFDNEQAGMLFVVARKAPDRVFQTILKIASASTAWARKPTVKASVRNTGSPIV
jgi:hypothetical protein